MTDYHRVHPVIAGSPLPAQEQAKDKQQPGAHGEQILPITAPPPYAPAPLRAPRRKRHSRCCRCVCWTLMVLIVLVVALGATAGILYAVFRPKTPNFSVDRLTATVNMTSTTVTDEFEVQVTAHNPNKRIGVYYDGGEVTAYFNGTELCSGPFPTLYQGHRTTVQPLITLKGETSLNSAVAAQLLQQQQAGFVPLVVNARVPIRIKFGVLKLWKMTGKARCNLVVDSLHTGKLRIRSNSCSFKLKV